MNVVLRNIVHAREGADFTVSDERTERFPGLSEALDKLEETPESAKESEAKVQKAWQAEQDRIAKNRTDTAGGKFK